MKALVINCSRNGLGVIRSLGVEGVSVIAVDDGDTNSPGLYSKYVSAKYIVNSIIDEEKFIEQIIDIGKKEYANNKYSKIPLFPVNDIYVLTFCKYWDLLKEFFIATFELNYSVLIQCVDKNKSAHLASDVGVPIPSTKYSPLTEADIKGLNYPVIIKPDLRNSIENTNKNVFRLKECSDAAELSKHILNLSNKDVSFVVQEFIPGKDDSLYTAGVFAYEGELLAVFTGRKLRQFPPLYGECSYGEAVSDSPELIKYSELLMKESGFSGIAQIEFKKYGGEYYLLEINPRSWSWNSLTTYCGVNLPWVAYRTVTGDSPSEMLVQDYNKQAKWIFSLVDFKHNVLVNKNINFFTFIKNMSSAECHSHYQKGDLKPMIYWLLSLLVHYVRKKS